MNDVLNTLTSIRQGSGAGLKNEKIDSKTLLRALTYAMDSFVLYRLGKKQSVKKNAGTNKIQWRRYKPLPVVANRGLITEGQNPKGMKVGATTVAGDISVYGAYIEVTKQTESYNLDQLLVEYGPIITSHASETLELITRDAIEEDGGHYYVVDAGTASPDEDKIKATNILTIDECRIVANTMKVARRKGFEGVRYTVVTPTEGMADLIDDEKLLKFVMTPGNTNKPIMDNGLENFNIYNLHFIEYDLPVIQNNSASVPIYHTYVFGEDAYAVMKLAESDIEMKRMGFEPKMGDNLGQRASLGWITWGFGAKVLDPVACTIISHAVSNALPRPTDIEASQS